MENFLIVTMLLSSGISFSVVENWNPLWEARLRSRNSVRNISPTTTGWKYKIEILSSRGLSGLAYLHKFTWPHTLHYWVEPLHSDQLTSHHSRPSHTPRQYRGKYQRTFFKHFHFFIFTNFHISNSTLIPNLTMSTTVTQSIWDQTRFSELVKRILYFDPQSSVSITSKMMTGKF